MFVLSLILKPRESVAPFQSERKGWNQISPTDILYVEPQDVDNSAALPLFPLHNGIAISGEKIDEQRATRVLILREKMRELHKKSSR